MGMMDWETGQWTGDPAAAAATPAPTDAAAPAASEPGVMDNALDSFKRGEGLLGFMFPKVPNAVGQVYADPRIKDMMKRYNFDPNSPRGQEMKSYAEALQSVNSPSQALNSPRNDFAAAFRAAGLAFMNKDPSIPFTELAQARMGAQGAYDKDLQAMRLQFLNQLHTGKMTEVERAEKIAEEQRRLKEFNARFQTPNERGIGSPGAGAIGSGSPAAAPTGLSLPPAASTPAAAPRLPTSPDVSGIMMGPDGAPTQMPPGLPQQFSQAPSQAPSGGGASPLLPQVAQAANGPNGPQPNAGGYGPYPMPRAPYNIQQLEQYYKGAAATAYAAGKPEEAAKIIAEMMPAIAKYAESMSAHDPAMQMQIARAKETGKEFVTRTAAESDRATALNTIMGNLRELRSFADPNNEEYQHLNYAIGPWIGRQITPESPWYQPDFQRWQANARPGAYSLNARIIKLRDAIKMAASQASLKGQGSVSNFEREMADIMGPITESVNPEDYVKRLVQGENLAKRMMQPHETDPTRDVITQSPYGTATSDNIQRRDTEGMPGAYGGPGGPPVLGNTAEDKALYDRLPPGTVYINKATGQPMMKKGGAPQPLVPDRGGAPG
jgi:hypothetical protein